MTDGPYNLAIETSSRHGSVTLGRGDTVVESVDLPEQRRHAVDLLPAIDDVCRRHGVTPAQIGEVYVSVGPGSFTGLRIGVTTAKVMGLTVGARLVAVPTLDAVARNAPADRTRVAVMLNAKRGQCFTGVYDRGDDGAWSTRIEPSLLTPGELCERVDGEVALIADKLPEHDWPARVTLLDRVLATPRSAVVWALGRAAAANDAYVDAVQLTPMYVRLPEAEEVWRAKESAGSQDADS